MPIRHDATALVRQGCSLDEVARRLRKPISDVIQYLRLQAGEGDIKLSEIFFAISDEKRRRMEMLIQRIGSTSPGKLQKAPNTKDLEWHEIDLYCRLRGPNIFRGDLYEYLADTEVAIHRLVKEGLVAEFGPEETQWWRQGISSEIRKVCVQTREDDPEPVEDKFAYSTLIQLAKIVDQNWRLFQNRLPSEFAQDKKRLLQEFARLNSLRNGVMHPAKGRQWGRDDLEFARDWYRRFAEQSCN